MGTRGSLDCGAARFMIGVFPLRYPVMSEPRGFKQLVHDLGLYDYWRATGKWGDFARPLGDDDFELSR